MVRNPKNDWEIELKMLCLVVLLVTSRRKQETVLLLSYLWQKCELFLFALFLSIAGQKWQLFPWNSLYLGIFVTKKELGTKLFHSFSASYHSPCPTDTDMKYLSKTLKNCVYVYRVTSELKWLTQISYIKQSSTLHCIINSCHVFSLGFFLYREYCLVGEICS